MRRQDLLRPVLRVPLLHRTVSRRFLLLLEVDGRSLRPRPVIRYATHDGALIAVPRPGMTWWRALQASGPAPAVVLLQGRRQPVSAELVAGDALDEAVLRYLQKYPGEWRALGVDARATADAVEEAARATPVVVLTPADP